MNPSHRPNLQQSYQDFERLAAAPPIVSDESSRTQLLLSTALLEAEDEIDRLLAKHGFVVARRHFDQALAARVDGYWTAANAHIAAFIERLLDEIAVKIDPSAVTLRTSQARCGRLASLGFLSRATNEWDENGQGVVNGLMNWLQPQGLYPAPSDQTDSAFRIHIVLLFARLLLARYDSWRS
jgi:hypothetical protein